MWPDRRLLDLFKVEHPIVLAPMAGAVDANLAIAVAEAGGLGSLPVAMLNEQQMRAQMEKIRAATSKPINVNFFVHRPPVPNNAREHAWRERAQALLPRAWHRSRRRRCPRATGPRSMRRSAPRSKRSSRKW